MKLTAAQSRAMNAIRGAHLYTESWRFEQLALTDDYFTAPAKAVLRRLARRGLIEISEVEHHLLDDGQTVGYRIILTSFGRVVLDDNAPKVYSASWYTPTGRNPRKRTAALKVGDIILVKMLIGPKEWRKIREIRTDTGVTGYYKICTSDDMGYGVEIEIGSFAATRWTVRAAETITS